MCDPENESKKRGFDSNQVLELRRENKSLQKQLKRFFLLLNEELVRNLPEELKELEKFRNEKSIKFPKGDLKQLLKTDDTENFRFQKMRLFYLEEMLTNERLQLMKLNLNNNGIDKLNSLNYKLETIKNQIDEIKEMMELKNVLSENTKKIIQKKDNELFVAINKSNSMEIDEQHEKRKNECNMQKTDIDNLIRKIYERNLNQQHELQTLALNQLNVKHRFNNEMICREINHYTENLAIRNLFEEFKIILIEFQKREQDELEIQFEIENLQLKQILSQVQPKIILLMEQKKKLEANRKFYRKKMIEVRSKLLVVEHSSTSFE